MKILAFVDLHSNISALRDIAKKAKKCDIIVCAGDISIFQQNLDFILERLNAIGKPILMINGNHEDDITLESACFNYKNIIFIHARSYRINNFIFFGYGGGGFSLEDEGFEELAKEFKNEIKKDDKVILVTHAPPYGTKVDMISKEHHGNKSIADFIYEVQPILSICGHLHETAGKKDMIGKTKIINPGAHGMIIEI